MIAAEWVRFADKRVPGGIRSLPNSLDGKQLGTFKQIIRERRWEVWGLVIGVLGLVLGIVPFLLETLRSCSGRIVMTARAGYPGVPESAGQVRRQVTGVLALEPRRIGLCALPVAFIIGGPAGRRCLRSRWSRLDGPGGEVAGHVPGGGIGVVRGFVQVGQGEARRELAADLPGE